MFARRAKLLWLLLIFSDLVLLVLAFELAYLVRAHLPQLRTFFLSPGVFAGLLVTAGGLWAALGLILQVYRRPENFGAGRMVRLTISQTFWFGMALATAIYLLKLGDISRSFAAMFVFLNFLLQVAGRLAARRVRQLLQREIAGQRCYLLVGTGPKAIELAQLIEKNKDHGDRVVGFVREPQEPPPAQDAANLLYPVWELAALPALLEEHVVDEILFAVSKDQLEKMEDLLLTCEEQGVRTRVLVDFFPHLRSDVSLDRL
ncbi:MAG: hypothetical protein HY648_07930, partial [Acidobacteria bacterium]|nr:hypothetical protein [Acidobacteriota bacterium]